MFVSIQFRQIGSCRFCTKSFRRQISFNMAGRNSVCQATPRLTSEGSTMDEAKTAAAEIRSAFVDLTNPPRIASWFRPQQNLEGPQDVGSRYGEDGRALLYLDRICAAPSDVLGAGFG